MLVAFLVFFRDHLPLGKITDHIGTELVQLIIIPPAAFEPANTIETILLIYPRCEEFGCLLPARWLF